MTDPSEQRFAVCSFGRVFDVEPKQELLTLGELLRFASRFEVKPQVLQRMRKAVAKVEKSLERVLSDYPGAGPVGAKLREAMRAAEEDGGDPVAAARQLAASLAHDARQSVKRDLRLWSPALYRPGARRGSEGVIHISCLVLDYDGGTRIEEASKAWSRWLHVAHSTWSFTEAHHKFRVVIPLAHPVGVSDWEAVWRWAEARAGGPVDPSGRGVASTFAIPTVGALGWPRRCISNPGDLLNPLEEHLVTVPAPPAEGPPPTVSESLVTGSRKYTYIAEPLPEGIAELPDAQGVAPRWDAEDAWDAFGSGGSALIGARSRPSPSPKPSDAAVVATMPTWNDNLGVNPDAEQESEAESGSTRAESATDSELAALREEIRSLSLENAELTRRLEGTPELRVPLALERVAALHHEGVLDDIEFEIAKRGIIEGDG